MNREQIDGLYQDLTFDTKKAGGDRPFVFINMVASVDGKITVEGSEQGLGSDADKRLFYELRAGADAVLDGANTARISGASPRVRPEDLQQWRLERGLSRHPLGVLLTASGNLRLDTAFFTSDEFQGVVFAARTIPPERLDALRQAGRPVHVVADGPAAITDMLRILRREHGVHRLLCEGGGTVNSQFFHFGCVDEVFLTIAPKIAGGRDNLTMVEGEPFTRTTMPPLALVSWHHHSPTGEVFTRWSVKGP